MTEYSRISPASQPIKNYPQKKLTGEAMPEEHGGQVIPFSGGKDLVSKDEITAAVQLWRFERDLSDALTREELGAMKMIDRMDAQRKTLLIGFAMYLRKHQRSDVALGVYLVQMLLSDNEAGLATVSQPTLAKMFSRSVSSIADAQRRLKEDGFIVMTRGRYAGTQPVIPRFVTEQYNHLAWIVGALASTEKPVNLPVRPDDCQSTGLAGGLNQISDQSSGPSGCLKPVNHPVEPPSIIRPDPIQLHSKNSKESKGEGPREGTVGKVAVAMAATILTSALPLAAQPIDPPAYVMQEAAECWQTPKTRMMAGLNINELRAQRLVWMTPTGLLEATGEFRDELERDFPAVSVKLGLTAAATNVNTEHGAMTAMKTIRRQFAYMQADAEGKQKRADAYKKPDGWIL